MEKCRSLVDPQAWPLLGGWSWDEAYLTDVPPHTAVRFALLDVLAPEVGEMETLTQH
jgi:hypothetical protein